MQSSSALTGSFESVSERLNGTARSERADRDES